MPYTDPEKQKAYQVRWHQANKERRRASINLNATAAKRRNLRFMRRVKAKGCMICGYNRCSEAIDFHHLRDKEMSLSRAAYRNRWSIKKLKEEIRKCIRLCANCHRELHAGLIALPDFT